MASSGASSDDSDFPPPRARALSALPQPSEPERSDSPPEPPTYPCFPCGSLGIECESLCCLKPLFTGFESETTKFGDLFEKFNSNINLLKSAAKKILAHLRDRWVRLGPIVPATLPPVDDLPKDTRDKLYAGKPCYPCWVVNSSVCVGCPLTGYFTEENLSDFEILRLEHEGDIDALKLEISNFETQSFGGVSVLEQVHNRVVDICMEGLGFVPDFGKYGRELAAQAEAAEAEAQVAEEELAEGGNLRLLFKRDEFSRHMVHPTSLFNKTVVGLDVQLANLIISASNRISPEGELEGDPIGSLEDFPDSGPLLRLLEEAHTCIVAAKSRVKRSLT